MARRFLFELTKAKARRPSKTESRNPLAAQPVLLSPRKELQDFTRFHTKDQSLFLARGRA